MSSVEWRLKGQYLKNCNCIASCPCDTMGRPYPEKGCEGIVGMNITEGHFGNLPLSGLRFAVVVWWSKTWVLSCAWAYRSP